MPALLAPRPAGGSRGAARAALAVASAAGALVGCTGGGSAPDAAQSSVRDAAPSPATAEVTPAPAPAGATDPGAPPSGAAGPVGEAPPTPPPGPTALADAPAPPGPSLTGPLPAAASARGGLVAGFPAHVVPVPASLDVVSSAVAGEGTRLQVALEASSDDAPDAVQAAYVAALTGAGFAAGDSPAVPGASATAFTRGPDGLVVTVRQRPGGGTELAVAGTLTTSG